MSSLSIVMIACLLLAINSVESKVLKIPVPSPDEFRLPIHRESSDCKKTCGKDAIEPLNALQKLELELYSMETSKITDKKAFVDNPDNQQSIVTLTPAQEEEILANYGDLFASTTEIEDRMKLREEAMASAADSENKGELVNSSRKKRASTTRVCPALQVYEALTLALTELNILVQVIQIPGVDYRQWFLQESCQYASSVVADADCATTDRLVQALIIDLNSGNIQYEWIRVRSCVSFV